ncbi:MAG: hypothetical protein Q8P67_17520 [archaeon]|nr:hypothetical protein [archaeon]
MKQQQPRTSQMNLFSFDNGDYFKYIFQKSGAEKKINEREESKRREQEKSFNDNMLTGALLHLDGLSQRMPDESGE